MGTFDTFTISQIKYRNECAGHYFFSRNTMKFFGNTMKDFRVRHVKQDDGTKRVYVINTVGGAVHEFDPETGHINNTKMTARDFGISTRPYPTGRWGL
jgi:hypothetical protein